MTGIRTCSGQCCQITLGIPLVRGLLPDCCDDEGAFALTINRSPAMGWGGARHGNVCTRAVQALISSLNSTARTDGSADILRNVLMFAYIILVWV